jgi:alpha-1,2-mannosyltransferase
MTRRPAVRIPPWLLLPGLALLVASIGCYTQLVHAHGDAVLGGLDLSVYQDGGLAWRHDEEVYRQGFTWAYLRYTYPPVTLLPFALLSYVPHATATTLFAVLLGGAVGLTANLFLGMLGHRGIAGRVGLTAGITAVAIWLEPVYMSMNLGQVNAFLMLLVVLDVALLGRTRGAGALIGVAAAFKLVPAIFVVYLLLTRRYRAALTAVVVFVALTVLGWVVDFGGSVDYWVDGMFLRSDRVGVPTYIYNQSLHGLSVRLFSDGGAGTVRTLLTVLVAVGGMALARAGHRRDGDPLGLLLCACTALLISPIAWTHHWVWCVPALVYAGDLTRRYRGAMQVLAAGIPTALVLVFVAWPVTFVEGAPLLPRGLFLIGPDFNIVQADPTRRTLVEKLAGEIYTLTGLTVLVTVAAWLALGRYLVVSATWPVAGGADPMPDFPAGTLLWPSTLVGAGPPPEDPSDSAEDDPVTPEVIDAVPLEPADSSDMTAYAIAHLHSVSDHDDILEYLERIQATLDPFGGRFNIHGQRPTMLEGTWPGTIVVIAFPSMERARAWYDSPAYQKILPLRTDHIEGDVILIEGVDPETYDAAATAAALRAHR